MNPEPSAALGRAVPARQAPAATTNPRRVRQIVGLLAAGVGLLTTGLGIIFPMFR